jgi:hypothetical protein
MGLDQEDVGFGFVQRYYACNQSISGFAITWKLVRLNSVRICKRKVQQRQPHQIEKFLNLRCLERPVRDSIERLDDDMI